MRINLMENGRRQPEQPNPSEHLKNKEGVILNALKELPPAMAGFAAGAATKYGIRGILTLSMGPSFGTTILAGAAGGAAVEGYRGYRREKVAYRYQEIIDKLQEIIDAANDADEAFIQDPSVRTAALQARLREAATIAHAKEIVQSSRTKKQEGAGSVDVDDDDRGQLADKLSEAITKIKSRAQNEFGTEQQDTKQLSNILKLASNVRAEVKQVGMARRFFLKRLIRRESDKFETDDVQVRWKEVAKSALKGAVVGAVGGALAASLGELLHHYYPNGLGQADIVQDRPLPSDKLDHNSFLDNAKFPQKPSVKGLTGSARTAIHDYLHYLNKAGGDLKPTPAQLVYAEDYLVKNPSLAHNGGWTGKALQEAISEATKKDLAHLEGIITKPGSGHFLSETTRGAMTNLSAPINPDAQLNEKILHLLEQGNASSPGSPSTPTPPGTGVGTRWLGSEIAGKVLGWLVDNKGKVAATVGAGALAYGAYKTRGAVGRGLNAVMNTAEGMFGGDAFAKLMQRRLNQSESAVEALNSWSESEQEEAQSTFKDFFKEVEPLVKAVQKKNRRTDFFFEDLFVNSFDDTKDNLNKAKALIRVIAGDEEIIKVIKDSEEKPVCFHASRETLINDLVININVHDDFATIKTLLTNSLAGPLSSGSSSAPERLPVQPTAPTPEVANNEAGVELIEELNTWIGKYNKYADQINNGKVIEFTKFLFALEDKENLTPEKIKQTERRLDKIFTVVDGQLKIIDFLISLKGEGKSFSVDKPVIQIQDGVVTRTVLTPDSKNLLVLGLRDIDRLPEILTQSQNSKTWVLPPELQPQALPAVSPEVRVPVTVTPEQIVAEAKIDAWSAVVPILEHRNIAPETIEKIGDALEMVIAYEGEINEKLIKLKLKRFHLQLLEPQKVKNLTKQSLLNYIEKVKEVLFWISKDESLQQFLADKGLDPSTTEQPSSDGYIFVDTQKTVPEIMVDLRDLQLKSVRAAIVEPVSVSAQPVVAAAPPMFGAAAPAESPEQVARRELEQEVDKAIEDLKSKKVKLILNPKFLSQSARGESGIPELQMLKKVRDFTLLCSTDPEFIASAQDLTIKLIAEPERVENPENNTITTPFTVSAEELFNKIKTVITDEKWKERTPRATGENWSVAQIEKWLRSDLNAEDAKTKEILEKLARSKVKVVVNPQLFKDLDKKTFDGYKLRIRNTLRAISLSDIVLSKLAGARIEFSLNKGKSSYNPRTNIVTCNLQEQARDIVVSINESIEELQRFDAGEPEALPRRGGNTPERKEGKGVLVSEDDYFGFIEDSDGRFTLTELSDGTYEVSIGNIFLTTGQNFDKNYARVFECTNKLQNGTMVFDKPAKVQLKDGKYKIIEKGKVHIELGAAALNSNQPGVVERSPKISQELDNQSKVLIEHLKNEYDIKVQVDNEKLQELALKLEAADETLLEYMGELTNTIDLISLNNPYARYLQNLTITIDPERTDVSPVEKRVMTVGVPLQVKDLSFRLAKQILRSRENSQENVAAVIKKVLEEHHRIKTTDWDDGVIIDESSLFSSHTFAPDDSDIENAGYTKQGLKAVLQMLIDARYITVVNNERAAGKRKLQLNPSQEKN